MIGVRTVTGYRWLIVLLAFGLLASCIIALAFGPASVPLASVAGIVGQQLGFAVPGEWTTSQAHIVWLIRAPRVVLGALVGAGLALVGTALQAVTRNPLADPHLLGVSSGAALGAVLVMLYLGEFIGVFSLPLAAFVGAAGSMVLVILVARRNGRLESDRLLLAGVAVSFVLMALVNLLLYTGDQHASASVLFWMLGGLGSARWPVIWLPALCVLLGLIALQMMGRGLNALMCGEQTAVSLGFSGRRLRLQVFICTSLLTGVLVSLSGAIGFVGLMVPHMARALVGAQNRRLLPVSALLGAVFLVWVDVAARTLIAPEDLPIGIATAALGGVFFILLLKR
ncbi:iron ABC transporter permease [Pseudomonas putida]|uniref:Iron ABC transporter permease n=1 Tax=Pseudomonas putida TaxID=303 RepID=A0A7W2KYT4_PSEPU|nr:iron ABC transporter permease [Pseudomonas putida]QNL88429.1 B12/iron complex ABC transporter permease protein [Pseudomonas putida]